MRFVQLAVFTVVLIGTVAAKDKPKGNSYAEKRQKEGEDRAAESQKRREAEEKLREEAAQLQSEIESKHQNSPSDRYELATYIMEKAFDMGTGDVDTGVTFSKIIKNFLKATSGESRLLMSRCAQTMDTDFDYEVEKQEFVEGLAPAVAYPEQSVQRIFRLYDLDSNGVISKYEWTLIHMMQMENDGSAIDLWREASLEFYDRDQTKDGVIDDTEFIMYELYELSYGISKEIEELNLASMR